MDIDILKILKEQLSAAEQMEIIVALEKELSLKDTAKIIQHFNYVAECYKYELSDFDFDLTPQKYNT